MKLSFNTEDLKNPKISIEKREILIRNYPARIHIIILIFFILCSIFLVYQPDNNGKIPFAALLFLMIIGAFYKSITIDTTIFRQEDKLIYFKSYNPFKNLIRSILKYPTTISYKNVSQIYLEDKPLVKDTFVRTFIIIETDDPYKIEIGTFTDKSIAELFLRDLKEEIFNL